MLKYEKLGVEEKLRDYEAQQPLIRLLKYELRRQDKAIQEAAAQGILINTCKRLQLD